MWILIGWFRTLMIIHPPRVYTMEAAACKGSEEVKPLSRFLRLAAALVLPVLFELRNDPRVKNTPKVKILFANPALNER